MSGVGAPRARRARFRLDGRFNGSLGATVTVVQFGQVALLEVRPLRSRKVYTRELVQVARDVIFEQVKAEQQRSARIMPGWRREKGG